MILVSEFQMSHYGRSTCDQKTAVVDHEKKYQEDLEQAKALSLESLALEKYRLEKLRLELSSNVHQACLAQNNVCNTNSVSETDSTQGERCLFLHLTYNVSISFNFVKSNRFLYINLTILRKAQLFTV